MYSDNYSEKAIPLVAVNENSGKYQMTPEAHKFLRSVPAPLGVVSVAGLYRTGKSYLLNKMLLNTKAKQGFGVGPTINPCTKGLWCWGTPIKGKSQNGQSINIIVIDTEGIGALDEDQTHDTKIFTLAILASSCFIYNSVGSIDQTAIQNLKLVVDLSKHIQVRSGDKYVDEDDADEVSNEFPTFYWVVRDFSLQLQDNQGKEITSKQYLEKALAPIKSSNQFDEDVQEKNKIRKTLTSFFKDRDCFTMVRPLVDETKLQDLDSIPIEELRPDFLEQVRNFRNKVTLGLKVKAMNNKGLTGDMYSNMLSSYIGAINDGAIPNIQNAWNYMCQEQCQKVQDECENIFDKQMRDNLKLPVEEQYFDSTCEHALDSAMFHFREKAIGDVVLSVKYERELKERIKDKVRYSGEENIKLSKEFLQKKVLEAFNPIIEQLKKQHFKTFEEFEKTINSTYENLINTTKNVPLMRQKFLQLYKKVQKQGAEYMFKCLNKETQNMRSIFEEKESHYKKELQMMSETQDNDRKVKSEEFERMDREKLQMERKIEKLQFELDKMIKDKQYETEQLSKNLSHKHSEFESIKTTLEEKVNTFQMNYDEINKKLNREQKEWEMKKSLMENKIQQQIENIAQLQKSCHSITQKYEEVKSESNQFHRQTVNKNEKRIGEMELEIKRIKEERFEENQSFREVKEDLEEKIEKFERNEKKIKQELISKKREFEFLKNEFESEKKKFEQQLQDQRDSSVRTKSTLGQDFKKQKETIISMTEELRKTKVDSENRIAVFEQKMQFLDQQKSFLKEQIQEMKFNHEKAMEDIKIQSGQEVEQREKVRIEEVKTEYITEIKNVQIKYESQTKQFMFENETLTKANEQMDLELKLVKEQLMTEKRNSTQYQEEMNDKLRNYDLEMKNLERSKESSLMEIENMLKIRIKDLERELQELKENSDMELRNSEQSKKEAIIQLRVSYENQREQMEAHYAKQKERAQRKYDEMVEEYESKHRVQIENMEEDFELFREQAQLNQDDLKSTLQEIRHQLESKIRDEENLRANFKELKQTLMRKEQEFSNKYESLLTSSRNEKESLNNKNEFLQNQCNKMQKQIMTISHERTKFSNELEKTRVSMKQLEEEYAIHRQKCSLQIEEGKRTLNQKESEFYNIKINYEKEVALLQQERQYITKKLNDQEKDLKNIHESYEQKMRDLKTEAEQNLAHRTEKLTMERNSTQEKYDKLKKNSKQAEMTMGRQISEMEKERAVDTQKIMHLESKYSLLEEKRRFDVDALEKELQKVRSMYKADKEEFSLEISRLNQQNEQINRRRVQIETKYDKETLLLKNQIQNEISIRETREKSYSENIRQLESRIRNLTETTSSEKSKAQSSLQEHKVRIEETYKTTIYESNKRYESLNKEFSELSKKSDSEIKDLRERLAIQVQNRESLQGKIERKNNEWLEMERRLNQEIDILKSERQMKSLEFQKALDHEKQSLKIKINNLQNMCKNAERQKNAQFMEHEKDKARSSQLHNSTTQELEHLKDKITKLQKDKNRLDKENERLKVEKRNTKNASYIRFTGNGGLEQRKSTITINTTRKTQQKQQMMEKKDSSEQKSISFEGDDKENMIISQNMMLGDD